MVYPSMEGIINVRGQCELACDGYCWLLHERLNLYFNKVSGEVYSS